MIEERKIRLSLAVAVMVLFSACVKDDKATVLLPLPIGDIQGINMPEGMLDHL